jgi:hypothetical protein
MTQQEIKFWRTPEGRCFRTKKCQQKRKHFIQSLKVNGCAICGYNKCIECLVFHHVNPEDKKFSISNGSQCGIKKTLNEINKCILLCKNCHGEIHYKEKIEA